MLVARRDAGALDLLPAALRAHADYCDEASGAAGRGPGPRDRRAGAAGARSVAPDLDAHLRLAGDVAGRGGRDCAGAGADRRRPNRSRRLRDFLTMYRADPGLRARPGRADGRVPRRCCGWAASADRELLLFLAEEPHTAAGLRDAPGARARRDGHALPSGP